MAILTKEVVLDTTWQLLTAKGFIAQKLGTTKVIEVCNADATPVGSVACHTIDEEENLQLSAPSAGSWYARVRNGTATIIYTEV